MIAIVLTMLKMLPVGDKVPPQALPWHLLPGRICRNGCGRGWPRPKEPGPEAEIAQRQTTEDEKRTLAFTATGRDGATGTEGERLQGQGAPPGDPVREQQESGRLTAA